MADPILTDPQRIDPNYLAIRDDLLVKNENFSTRIYFDSVGIPTLGIGVALITRDESGNFAINTDSMQSIANVLGANDPKYISILSFAQKTLTAIQGTSLIDPTGGAMNLADFRATQRGQAIISAFGSDIEYDVEARAYRQGPNFKPIFASGSADEYLSLLKAYCYSHSSAILPAMGSVPNAELLTEITASIESHILKCVMNAIRNSTSIEISYQSFSDTAPSKRVIWPHVLVNIGNRWHVRAYDEKRKNFRDFVLVRFNDVSESSTESINYKLKDGLWNETESVAIIPAPRLSVGQKEVIAKEFGMTLQDNGQFMWIGKIRKCLVGYFLVHHRIELGGSVEQKATLGQNPYIALLDPKLADQYRFSEE